jgi:hypothetical protein
MSLSFLTEHSSQDKEFLERCLEAYCSRLPDSLRTGLALPKSNPTAAPLPYWIPQEMWDGMPDEMGYVHWKYTRNQPSLADLFSREYPRYTPPLFKAYLETQRVGRLLFRDDRLSLLLPATPTHAPRHDFAEAVGEGSGLPDADLLSFAVSEDGALLACFDRHNVSQGEDSPVVLISAEDAFRLAPHLRANRNEYDRVHHLTRPLFGSFREMLTHFCLGDSTSWTGTEPCPYARVPEPIPPPFDWEPWLLPEPALGHHAPPQNASDVDHRALAEHCARIAAKVGLLRRLDPGFVWEGSECHRHRLNPRLLPTERQDFEQTEGCQLPDAYAAFLAEVGNGGFGPWRGLWRLEWSGAFWASVRDGARRGYENRLRKPFPHRAHWNPDRSEASEDSRQEYLHPRHIDGTVLLGYSHDPEGTIITMLLVVNGPEQGHVWSDHRRRIFGVKPVFRRGPYSFLAWYEAGVDYQLAHVEEMYADLRASLQEELGQGTSGEG